jgi:hypothetical protein
LAYVGVFCVCVPELRHGRLLAPPALALEGGAELLEEMLVIIGGHGQKFVEVVRGVVRATLLGL